MVASFNISIKCCVQKTATICKVHCSHPYMYQHNILIARLSVLNQGFTCQVAKAKIVLLLFPG